MNKSTLKVIGLVLTIALPLFFYLMFKPITKIPRPRSPHKMFPLGVDKYKDAKGKEVIDTLFHVIPSMQFTTQDGEKMDLDSLYGNVYVLDFFFATCPGICPVLTKQMVRVQNAFIKDKNFKLVSVSVDPVRDSVLALREYAKNYGAVANKWYFLTAPKSNVFKLASEGFFLVAKENPKGEEAFIHSEKLTLVDAEGHIRGYYNGTDSLSVNKMMGDIVLVLREYEKNFSFRKNPKERGSLFSK
jgi:protein SCO1/2